MTDLRERAVSRPSAATSRVTVHDHSAGLLVLRLIVGVVMVGHGTQKLFGWFGGGGISGTAAGFDKIGYSPGTLFAVIGGLLEAGGGLLLILGLGTALAGAGLVADMLGATMTVAAGGSGAFFAQNGGFEYELVLALAAAALTLTGAGRYAFDHGRPWDVPRFRWALLGLGLVGGAIGMLMVN